MKRNVEVFGTLLCALMMTGASMAPQPPPDKAHSMARSSWAPAFPADIDALLTEAARNGVASFRSEERSFVDVLINVHHDAAGRQVVIDVLRGYRPDHPGAEMEDFEQWVGNSVRELTEKFSPAPEILFLYGGKSFEALFPLQARRMDAVRHHSLRCGGPGAAIPAVSGSDAGRGKSPHAPATDSELDALLTREALRVLRRLQPLEGQRIGGPVRASMDLDTGSITVYFPRDFLPADPEGGFEDQLDNFRHALMHVSAPFVDATGMEYRYGGRHLYVYFPRLQREDEAARLGSRRQPAVWQLADPRPEAKMRAQRAASLPEK